MGDWAATAAFLSLVPGGGGGRSSRTRSDCWLATRSRSRVFDDLYQLGRDDDGEYGRGTLLGEYLRSRDGWLAHEVSLTGLLPIARNGGNDTRRPGTTALTKGSDGRGAV